MPYILGLDELEERAERKEAQARQILKACNYAFVFFSTACIVLNYLGQIKNVWICKRIRPLQGLPYLILAGVLIYSMLKVKTLLQTVSQGKLYTKRKIFWLHALMLISYVF